MTISIHKRLLTACLLLVFAIPVSGCDTIKEITAPAVEAVKEGVDNTFEITCNKPLGKSYVALEGRLDHAVTLLANDEITLNRYDAIEAQIDLYRAELSGYEIAGTCDTDPDSVHDSLDTISIYLETIDEELNYEEPV